MNPTTTASCAASTGTTPNEGKENAAINFSSKRPAPSSEEAGVRPALVSPEQAPNKRAKTFGRYFIPPVTPDRFRYRHEDFERIGLAIYDDEDCETDDSSSVVWSPDTDSEDDDDDDLSIASYVIDEFSDSYKLYPDLDYDDDEGGWGGDLFFSKDYHDVGDDAGPLPELFELAYQSSFRKDMKDFLIDFRCRGEFFTSLSEHQSDPRYGELTSLRARVIDRLRTHPEEVSWRHPKSGKYFIHYLMSAAFMGISGFTRKHFPDEFPDEWDEDVQGVRVLVGGEKGLEEFQVSYLTGDMVEIASLAIEACPEALTIADNDGIYPIHYACKWLWRESEIIAKLLEASPRSAFLRDEHGDLPFHRLWNLGDAQYNLFDSSCRGLNYVRLFETLKIVVEHNPRALLMKDGNDHDSWTLFCYLHEDAISWLEAHKSFTQLGIWMCRKRADVAGNPFLMLHDMARHASHKSSYTDGTLERRFFSEAFACLRDNADLLSLLPQVNTKENDF